MTPDHTLTPEAQGPEDTLGVRTVSLLGERESGTCMAVTGALAKRRRKGQRAEMDATLASQSPRLSQLQGLLS